MLTVGETYEGNVHLVIRHSQLTYLKIGIITGISSTKFSFSFSRLCQLTNPEVRFKTENKVDSLTMPACTQRHKGNYVIEAKAF